jgi:hypothetical protein
MMMLLLIHGAPPTAHQRVGDGRLEDGVQLVLGKDLAGERIGAGDRKRDQPRQRRERLQPRLEPPNQHSSKPTKPAAVRHSSSPARLAPPNPPQNPPRPTHLKDAVGAAGRVVLGEVDPLLHQQGLDDVSWLGLWGGAGVGALEREDGGVKKVRRCAVGPLGGG